MNLANWYTSLVKNPCLPFVYTNGHITSCNHLNGLRMAQIYSGSFNPLHDRHKYIYELINSNFSLSARYYEISIHRFGKGYYSVEELEKILGQFDSSVIVTNAATFLEKLGTLSLIEPTFHIGYDTFDRLMSVYGFYGVQGLPCTFYVYDRNGSISKWTNLPKNVKRLDHDNRFEDLSSTELRKSAQSIGCPNRIGFQNSI